MGEPKNQVGSSELEKLLLFRGVDLSSARGLLEDCSIRDLKPGDVLIRGGEPNQSLYLVLSGHFGVFSKGAPNQVLDSKIT